MLLCIKIFISSKPQWSSKLQETLTNETAASQINVNVCNGRGREIVINIERGPQYFTVMIHLVIWIAWSRMQMIV